MGQKRQNVPFLAKFGHSGQKLHILIFLSHFLKSLTQVLYTIGIIDFFLNFWDPENLKKSIFFLIIMVHPNFKPISHQEEISQM